MKTHVEFHDGTKMPIVGYGMWQSDDHAQLESCLEMALEAGYRHFDTAWGYKNEAVLGKVLKKWIDAGKIKREDVFITTKVLPTGSHPDRIANFIDIQLKALQLDYVDLYLMHNPASIKVDDTGLEPLFVDGKIVIDTSSTLEETWKALEEKIYKTKKAKNIGMSNFSPSQMERIMKVAEIKPANNQVELNAMYPKKDIREVAKKHGITVTSFASLGSPGRKDYYALNCPTAIGKVKIPSLLENEVVNEIAKKHDKSPGQILLRFLVQQDVVVIPRSMNSDRMKSNLQILDFELDADSMAKLDSLDTGEAGTWGFDWNNSLPGIKDHPDFQLQIGEL